MTLRAKVLEYYSSNIDDHRKLCSLARGTTVPKYSLPEVLGLHPLNRYP